MSPSIRVDDDVYNFLKGQAEPFVDTPNTVLRRLLALDKGTEMTPARPVNSEGGSAGQKRRTGERSGLRGSRSHRTRSRKRGPRAPAGSLLRADEYVVPLLQVLLEKGGSAPAREVIEAVGNRLDERLTSLDRQPTTSGVVRWQNRVQFVRLRLVEQGLLAKNSPRGVWSLTEAGRRSISEVA